DLIAERIETETTVVDLLDYDVRFGQGFLFSPPRPVRAEALQGPGVTVESGGGESPGGLVAASWSLRSVGDRRPAASDPEVFSACAGLRCIAIRRLGRHTQRHRFLSARLRRAHAHARPRRRSDPNHQRAAPKRGSVAPTRAITCSE